MVQFPESAIRSTYRPDSPVRAEPRTNETEEAMDDDMGYETEDDPQHDGIIPLNNEDVAAARALVQLARESSKAMRRLVNHHHGNLGRVVMDIITQANRQNIHRTKTAEEIQREGKDQMNKRTLECALSLIELSGQSTEESRAALALGKLKRESHRTLRREAEYREKLKRMALQKKKASDHFLALEKFRKQFPAVLATQAQQTGMTMHKPTSSRLREVTTKDQDMPGASGHNKEEFDCAMALLDLAKG